MKDPVKKPLFPLSIRNYAVLFLCMVAIFFTGIGFYAYERIDQARSNIQERNLVVAKEEVDLAVKSLLKSLTATIDTVSKWDEAFQQLDSPAYYSYWRKYRLLHAGVLPDYVEAAEIFDAQGRALAQLTDNQFPAKIELDELDPAIDLSRQGSDFISYLPMHRAGAGNETQGYIGLRMPFIKTLLSLYHFRYIDIDSLVLANGDRKLSLSELHSMLHFELKASPEAESMMAIVDDSLIELAVVTGVLCLLLYFLMVYMISKPILGVSRYIDELRLDNPVDKSKVIPSRFSVAEVEKIRNSLDVYHADLGKATTDLDEKNKELWVLAHHDSLTGVLNRRAFENEWNNSKQLLRNRRVGVGLILFDVNHFKAINDSYGHQVGDDVLKSITDCLQNVIRSAEKIYRIGGDEFAAIIIGASPDDLMELAQRCVVAVEDNDFSFTGIKEKVRISCGISHCSADDLERLDNLQWQADVAIYKAKRPGVTRPIMFSENMADGSEAVFSSWMSDAVYDAVTNGSGIEIHYQPIVDSVSQQVVYYEALLRIRYQGELIPPSHIFPIVTMRQLEVSLDRLIV